MSSFINWLILGGTETENKERSSVRTFVTSSLSVLKGYEAKTLHQQ